MGPKSLTQIIPPVGNPRIDSKNSKGIILSSCGCSNFITCGIGYLDFRASGSIFFVIPFVEGIFVDQFVDSSK